MSFILDGLKKSEQERGDAEVPGLHTMHDIGGARTRPRFPLWGRALVVALLLNVLVLVWLLGPWSPKRSGQAGAVGKPVAATAAGQAAPDVLHTAQPSQAVAPPSQAPSPAVAGATARSTQNGPGSSPAVEPKNHVPATAATFHAKQAPVKRHAVASASRAPKKNSQQATRQTLYSLKDLPAAIRQEVPPLTLSLHYFTDTPASRLIRLNGLLLREGDSLTAEIKVATITSRGVILSCQGFRFFLPTPKEGN